jgi:hypothetical protein
MIPKLSRVYYGVRSVFCISNIDTLKEIYFACFHFIRKYGIIFWDNTSNSKLICTLQKRKIVIIMAGASTRSLCRRLCMRLENLPLPCEYTFSLLSFIANNQEHFLMNSAIHTVNTRNMDHLHRPIANLSYFQKGAYYFDIRMFNNLQLYLKSLLNKKGHLK